MKTYKKLILECFDFTGYTVQAENDTPEAQVACAYSIFLSEMGWQLKAPYNKPLADVCQQWLQGLASACTIPFYNNDILQWGENNGLIKPNASEKKQDQFIDQYWLTTANALASMFQRSANGYKIV